MKIKKSKFAKLLALTLPIAAISIVTPVVLTSCGSSTSNGGSSGDNTQTYDASWDTSKTQDGLTFDTTNNSAVITLKNDKDFAATGISKKSTFDNIKSSLEPTSTGTSLYSVLSGAIKDVGNYDVKLLVDTNPVNFDYTNDSIGNYFGGQFQLTPKKSGEATVNLKFRINNFNDSYNGKDGNDISWNIDAIKSALESKNANTGNKLPDVQPSDKGASVTIDLSKEEKNGLGHVMDELCKTTISTDELKSFIKNYDNNNYDFSNATISSWAPNVDGTSVFTRVVVPSKTSGGREAILYLAYTGLKNDDGNAVWNRNIVYPDNVNGKLSDQNWDNTYKEPVIDLSKVDGNIGSSSISKDSTLENITNKDLITPVVEYMVNNYIMGSQNFNYCFTGIKDSSDTTSNTIVQGTFDDKGDFKPTTSTSVETKNATNNKESDSSTENNSPLKNKKAVEFKILLTPKKGTSATQTGTGSVGIWRSFYIIDYKNESNK